MLPGSLFPSGRESLGTRLTHEVVSRVVRSSVECFEIKELETRDAMTGMRAPCVLLSLLVFACFPWTGWSMANTIPESGSIIAGFVGDENITLFCEVFDDEGAQDLTSWSLQKLGEMIDGITTDDPNFAFDGEPVPTFPNVTFGTNLTILTLTEDLDGAIIFCGAIGVDEEAANFTIRIDRQGLNASLEPPETIVFEVQAFNTAFEPSEIIANEGENATMTCEIFPFANPQLQMQVMRDFDDVPDEYPRLVKEFVETPAGMNNRTRFIILDVNRTEDGTEFRCRYGHNPSNVGTLDVRFAPQYTDPDDQVVREGDDFSLSIMLDPGNPEAVNFQWQFNDSNISSNARITLTNDSIMISGVQRSDDGTYSVTTYNSVGDTTVEFDLDVQFAPQYTDPGDQVVREGDGFGLSIPLDPGDPKAVNFQWQFDGNNISNDTRITLTRDSIMITDVQRSDDGTYSVTTYNTVGATTVEFNLDVQPLPRPVTGVGVDFDDDNNVVISWSFESNDEFPTLSFMVVITDGTGNQVFSDSVMVPSGNVASTSVDIENELEFSTDYTVSVIATNDVGDSAPETATFTTPERSGGIAVVLSTSLLTAMLMMFLALAF